MIVIVMGVAGSGKSTVAKVLAKRLGWQYKDADAYHSQENVAKMSEGIPLTDADRAPWLQSMRNDIEQWISSKQDVVLACSALKESYREKLTVDLSNQRFVYLKGSRSLFAARLARRRKHFMKVDMLDSQLAALEEPNSKCATICDASSSIKQIVDEIESSLSRASQEPR